jgi:hypothetical protein
VSPATITGWTCGVLLSRRAPAALEGATLREWGEAIRQPTVRVTVPDVRATGERGVFGCASIVRSPWRLSGPAGAAPVEFLERGSGLLACEYRTRSML